MELQVNGQKAYAYTGGKPFDAALPTVVFIHGAQNDHSVWLLQSRWFAHHGFGVLAVDLPGHGRSEGGPLPTIQDLADWIELLLERCGAGAAGKNVTLVGHSMGSLTALECASRHPARIARIALIGTAVPMPVSDTLLDAAKNDEPRAIAMINSWSHSPRATFGGYAVPGIWHFGAARRLAERQAPGVLHNDLSACNGLRARHGGRGRPGLPGPDRQRQPRHDDPSQGRRQTGCRHQGREERQPRRRRPRPDGGTARCRARQLARIHPGMSDDAQQEAQHPFPRGSRRPAALGSAALAGGGLGRLPRLRRSPACSTASASRWPA
jgi:pimeloyl-ACP methyl ester carboxylesterase